MTIYLVRHGESEANAGAVADATFGASPLTARGCRQALDLGLRFWKEGKKIDRIITSTFKRAEQTGQLIAQAAQGVDEDVKSWLGIHEWTILEPSKYAGTTHEERQPAVRDAIERWDPAHKAGPGAESFYELMKRVENFRGNLLEMTDGNTVFVSHGWFIKAVLWSAGWDGAYDNGMKSYWHFANFFALNNCQVIQLIR